MHHKIPSPHNHPPKGHGRGRGRWCGRSMTTNGWPGFQPLAGGVAGRIALFPDNRGRGKCSGPAYVRKDCLRAARSILLDVSHSSPRTSCVRRADVLVHFRMLGTQLGFVHVTGDRLPGRSVYRVKGAVRSRFYGDNLVPISQLSNHSAATVSWCLAGRGSRLLRHRGIGIVGRQVNFLLTTIKIPFL